MHEASRPDTKRGDGWTAEALLVALAAICAVVAATRADLDAPTAWTLVAGVAAAYIVGRGAARGRWFAAGAPAPAAARAAQAPSAPPAAGGRFTREGPAVTLHEEQIEVGRRQRPHERVRIHKHVVTEYVTLTVPVRREVLRIEHVPIDAPHDARAEADLTLMQDEPVVETRIVAKERVHVGADVVTEEREVRATVRREQADIDRQPVPHAPSHTNPID